MLSNCSHFASQVSKYAWIGAVQVHSAWRTARWNLSFSALLASIKREREANRSPLLRSHRVSILQNWIDI